VRIPLGTLIIGVVASGLVGLLALRVLMGMVRQGRLSFFAPYRWIGRGERFPVNRPLPSP
jgi:undecaprenyl pyrophosphate phosphatase UppP